MNINTNSDEWIAVAKWANVQIVTLREQNDDETLTERETAAIRGQIAALKNLLNIPGEQEISPNEVSTTQYL